MILDYTTPAPAVPESGYAAYKRKFDLQNGYPTYAFSAADVSLDEERDGGGSPDRRCRFRRPGRAGAIPPR